MIGFFVGEYVPDDGEEFSCGGSSCCFVSFFVFDVVVIVLDFWVEHGCPSGAFVEDPFEIFVDRIVFLVAFCVPGLVDAGAESGIADEVFGCGEAVYVPDFCIDHE